jgi:hypothetical protein
LVVIVVVVVAVAAVLSTVSQNDLTATSERLEKAGRPGGHLQDGADDEGKKKEGSPRREGSAEYIPPEALSPRNSGMPATGMHAACGTIGL